MALWEGCRQCILLESTTVCSGDEAVFKSAPSWEAEIELSGVVRQRYSGLANDWLNVL